jgi:predicted phosphodiesterase
VKERVKETVVGIYDAHITGKHGPHPSYLAVKKFVKETRPEVILIGGDFVELDCIRKNRNKYVMSDQETYHADMEAAKKELWELRVWCPDSRFIFLVGNHEKRIDWYMDDTPAMRGHLGLEKDLELHQMGVEVIPYNEVVTIGKLNYIHGWYWTVYHARKTLDIFGDNIAYGHVHEHQVYTRNIRSQNKPHIAISVPCLSAVNPDWKQGQPTRFQNGFIVVEYREKGHFTAHTIIIIEGVFSYGGYIWRA